MSRPSLVRPFLSSRRSRSPSPGLFGSTAASRAKQREAIAARSRSASTATSGPGRREQEQESKKTSLYSIMKNTERSTSSQSTSSSSYSSVLRSEAETFDFTNKTQSSGLTYVFMILTSRLKYTALSSN